MISIFHAFVTRRFLWPVATALLLITGCGQQNRVSDPQLRPVQEMLDAELPVGTPNALVNQLISARGYPIEAPSKPDTMVVIIRHIDRQKLQPVTARVTFQFDSRDRLISTDVVPIPNQAPPR